MKHIHWLFALVVASPQLMASDIGLYDISDPSHPKPFDDQVERAAIFSMSNDNKHYFLALHALHSFSLPCSQVGLVVGKTTIRFSSQGEDDKGRFTSMEATINDPEVIPQIAKYLHAAVQKRRHPGHRMLVEYIPEKSEFSVGEPVIVRLRITNIGNTEFAFIEGGRQRGPRDNQFAFSAELAGGKMVPDTGDPLNYGGLGMPVVLKPGESQNIQVDLTRWFNFKRHEKYDLRGSYHMNLIDPKAKDSHTIWEDYACAEFTVKMKN